MPSKIAQQRVRRQIRDIVGLETHAVRAAVIFSLMLRKKIATDFFAVEHALWECMDPFIMLLTKAMLYGHLTGRHRSYLTAGVGFWGATDVYDEALQWARQRAKLSEDSVKQLEAVYSKEATRVAVGFDHAVNQRLNRATHAITAAGHHTREGQKLMQRAFEAAGIGKQDPHLVATLTRTQTQMAYNAGRWEANQDPELDEIIWGYEYIAIDDARVRPWHVSENGVRKPKDDIYWTTYWPSNGYNCRCTTIEVFKNETLRMRPTELAETARVHGKEVVRRVDPGFNFHSGRMFGQNIRSTTLPSVIPIRPPPSVPERFLRFEIARPGGGKWNLKELIKLLGETANPKERKWIRTQLRKLGHKGGLKGIAKPPVPKPTVRVPTPTKKEAVSLLKTEIAEAKKRLKEIVVKPDTDLIAKLAKTIRMEEGGSVTSFKRIQTSVAQEYLRIHGKYHTVSLPHDVLIGKSHYLRVKVLVGQSSGGVKGLYNSGTKRITLARGTPKATKLGKIKKGGFSVHSDNDVSGSFRHEMGHHVQEGGALSQQSRKDWSKIYRSQTTEWWKKNLSVYGSADEYEAFAETFCYYTHPEYGTAKVPKLASIIHDYMARVVKVRTVPKPVVGVPTPPVPKPKLEIDRLTHRHRTPTLGATPGKAQEAWIAGVKRSKSEWDAIGNYTQKGYEDIRILQTAPEKLMKAVLGRTRYNTAFRQVEALEAAYARRPVQTTTRTLYRGLHDLSTENAAKLAHGDEIRFRAWASTSTSKETARVFAERGGDHKREWVRMRLKTKEGMNIEGLAYTPGEREIMLPKGIKFRVKRAIRVHAIESEPGMGWEQASKIRGKGWILDCEEIL